MSEETSLRFIFEDTDIRGDFVRLNESYREIIKVHDYPERVANLLGEFLVASVLLSGIIKYKGRFVLQIRSEGKIPMLMVEATHDKKIRGIARLSTSLGADGEPQKVDIEADADFAVLFAKGTLVVIVDPSNGEQYQSVVPLEGNSLESCLIHYFAQSEQLGTSIKLAADGVNAAGFLIQQLPAQLVPKKQAREAQWDHHLILGNTVKAKELLELEGSVLIRRLYGEEKIRVMATEAVKFECNCSTERTGEALIAIDPVELEELLSELGSISMRCEFCQTNYEFDRESLADLVRGDGTTH
jgi:molecular chaperone Hsp33